MDDDPLVIMGATALHHEILRPLPRSSREMSGNGLPEPAGHRIGIEVLIVFYPHVGQAGLHDHQVGRGYVEVVFGDEVARSGTEGEPLGVGGGGEAVGFEGPQ